MSQRILFALTSHGLGHTMRSLAVARSLKNRHPDVEIVVATTTPQTRVARELGTPFVYRPVDYEPGTLQCNCFEMDIPGTRQAYRRYVEDRPRRLGAEIDFLHASGCTAVVSDIPALPVHAAAQVGLPAIGISNFTWDWILGPLFAGSDVESVVALLAADYAGGTIQLRLPFGPDESPFPRSEPAPLVSRRARLDAKEVRRRLEIPQRDPHRLVVVCPGGWDPDAWAPIHVRRCDGVRFLTVGDLPVTADAPLHRFPHELPLGVTFPDLVAAADLVVSKPGYGIASECASHRTGMVVIERPLFREGPLLLETFRRWGGPIGELSLADFFAGQWESALVSVLSSQSRWSDIPTDGTNRVARRLAEILKVVPIR